MNTKPKKVALLVEGARQIDRALLRGVGKYSRIFGPWSFYNGTNHPIFINSPRNHKTVLNRIKKWRPDAILTRYPKLIGELSDIGVPTLVAVYIEMPDRDLPVILLHHRAIAQMAAEHLLARGFQNFAYYGYSDRKWSQYRAECFGDEIKKNNNEVDVYGRPLLKLKHSWESEQQMLAKWVESLPKPVGVMACNDDCGLQLIDACKLTGCHIPDEVAIVGVDNDQLACDLADPPLSSVELNVERIGYDAAELLDNMMDKKVIKDKRLIIQPIRVVQRQSTNVLAIEDKSVRLALRYINNHNQQIVQVDDIANSLGIARRTLEFRFQKLLKRSIYSVVKQVRVEYISKLLIETDMTLVEIANKMGYTEAHNLSRQFKNQNGLSPEDYRKKFRK